MAEEKEEGGSGARSLWRKLRDGLAGGDSDRPARTPTNNQNIKAASVNKRG